MIALFVAPSPKPVAEIPCKIVQNLVLLDVKLNARATTALLDSGADSSYADASAALAAGASKGAAMTASGAGAQAQSGWEAKGLNLSFSGLTLKQPVKRAFPLQFPIPGAPKVEAVLGHDLFAAYAVEIDYAEGRVWLYDPKSVVVPASAKVVPLALERNVPFATLSLALPGAAPKPIKTLVDTGVNVGLYLTASYGKRERLAERFPDAQASPAGTGVGGGTKTRLLPGAKLNLAGRSLDTSAWLDLSSGGVTGPEATFDGLLGGEILRRFRVTFDVPHGRLIVQDLPK